MHGDQLMGMWDTGPGLEQSRGQKLDLGITQKVMFKTKILGGIFERESVEKSER